MVTVASEDGNMRPQDKIIKATWNSFEAAKDTVIRNMLSAFNDGKIKIDPSATQAFVALMGASLDEGFQKSLNVFTREVSAILEENEKKRAQGR